MPVFIKCRNSKTKKTTICCMLGPFWPMLCMVTIPMVVGISCAITFGTMIGRPLGWQITFLVFAFFTLACLLCTAFSDPGLLRRAGGVDAPVTADGQLWRFDRRANSYKPPGAEYCPDCNVVIEEFDHTCPWTGTGIGKKNLKFFYGFLTSCCCGIGFTMVTALFAGNA